MHVIRLCKTKFGKHTYICFSGKKHEPEKTAAEVGLNQKVLEQDYDQAGMTTTSRHHTGCRDVVIPARSWSCSSTQFDFHTCVWLQGCHCLQYQCSRLDRVVQVLKLAEEESRTTGYSCNGVLCVARQPMLQDYDVLKVYRSRPRITRRHY